MRPGHEYITPEIKLSRYTEKVTSTEIMFEHHLLAWTLSGEAKIVMTDGTYIFQKGDIFLIPRNQVASAILNPCHGEPYQAVSMHLSTERLRSFYSKLEVSGQTRSHHLRSFKNHPLLESFLASLLPYFEMEDPFPPELAEVKMTEAITILRAVDKGADQLLSDFEQPGKIDLAGFMEKNFMFNLPLEQFGYLTGRSLSTFKRDFKQVYNTSPQKWLTSKRLERAHYEFAENKKKPTDVYFEVGFENLSHFSYAFKKQFGYPPSALL